MFVTHAHWDHIIGAPFFGPLWQKDARITIHALSRRAEKSVSKMVMFDGEHFPVAAQDIPAKVERPPFTGNQVRVGSATVTQVFLNHPGGCDGFRIDDADGTTIDDADGTTLCYLTDNELSPPGPLTTTVDALAAFAEGASLVIHDAQYLPGDMPQKRGWGHSVVDEVLALGKLAEVRALALHHHDPWRDDAALDAIAAHSESWALAHAPKMQTLVAREGLTIEL
jgi:ribonuclease BN (tRNA processing enzyme)